MAFHLPTALLVQIGHARPLNMLSALRIREFKTICR
jgi:hypothetical protein